MNMDVQTNEKCTYTPKQNCQGDSCEIQIEFDDPWCNEEIQKRRAGKNYYGPAKFYGLALCKQDTVLLGSIVLSRSTASILVVSLDLLALLLFYLSLLRLQFFESLFERDT